MTSSLPSPRKTWQAASQGRSGRSWSAVFLAGLLALAGTLPSRSQEAEPWLRRPWTGQSLTLPAGWYHGAGEKIVVDHETSVIWQQGSLVEEAHFRQGRAARTEMRRLHLRGVYWGISLGTRLEAEDCLLENSRFGKINGWYDAVNPSTKWRFNNCVFLKAFKGDNFNVVDSSVRAVNRTFIGVKRPTIGYRDNNIINQAPDPKISHNNPGEPAGNPAEPGGTRKEGMSLKAKPGRPLQALRTEIRRLQQQIGSLESGLQAAVQDLQLVATFVNTAGVAEGLPVLRSTLSGKPGLLANVDHVELLMTFDAARAPMKRHSGKPEKMEGAYATEALVSANPSSMMLWGPFAPLEKGRYLITWRLKFEGPLPLLDTCFLDVCYNAVTFSGRRPHADETPAGQWIEASVPLAVPDPRPFEFRFWPNASFVALDRIYVYRLHERPQAAAGPIFCSVMGAALRTGTHEFAAGRRVADGLARSGGANAAGNPGVCLLHRQENGQSTREALDLTAGGGEKLLQHGDILEVPEK